MRKYPLIGLTAVTMMTLAACSGGTTGGQDADGEYPSQRVRLIIPYAAGGPTDIVGRGLAEFWETELGWEVVPENVEGASGTLGMREMIQSDPDGHTIAITGTSAAVIGPAVLSDAGYTHDDFADVGSITQYPFVIAVGEQSDIDSTDDFMKVAKENAGSIKLGTPGAVSQPEVDIDRMGEKGINVGTVPFNGNSEAIAAMLGGNVDGVIQTASQDILQQFDSGKAQPIMVLSAERVPYLPDVPTATELGLEGIDKGVSYYGLGVPEETSDEVKDAIADALSQALEDPETRERVGELFIADEFVDGDSLSELFAAQGEYYGPIMQEMSQ